MSQYKLAVQGVEGSQAIPGLVHQCVANEPLRTYLGGSTHICAGGTCAMHVIFLSVLVLSIAVVVLLRRVRKRFPSVLTATQQNTVLGPFAFVVTLYAFLLSFVVITLWQTFTQAQRTAVHEAEAVSVLYRLTESFPGTQASRQTLLQYVQSVIHDEWSAMASGKPSQKTEALY